ncbi:MAG: carboxymuconolactone decarboxylase family protein [Flavobacteriaceae bacterium]|nr:carboxymuconolactone decarboxylase family protein [Flavobacteriaceae bacterium]
MNTEVKSGLDIKTIENAPEASKRVLTEAKKAYGFVPNLLGIMANNPVLLNSYWDGNVELSKNGTLTAIEQQVVFLAVSYENNCHYCMAAHTSIGQMSKVPQDVLDALRDGKALPNPRLEVLSQYAKATTIKRGRVSEQEISDFYDAGFTKKQQLEVIVITGFKVFTNYINYLAQTPVDDAFKPNVWKTRN